MREYNKCVNVCTEAMEHDKEGKHTREIQAQEAKALQAQYAAREGETEQETMERIQRDPEVIWPDDDALLKAANRDFRLSVSCKTPSCKPFCNKQRKTRPRYKSISRTQKSGPRFRSLSMRV